MSPLTVELETVPCLACGSSTYEKLFAAPSDPVIEFGYFDVVACTRCGLRYTNPRPIAAAVAHFYGTAYYGPEHRRFFGPLENLITFFRRRRLDRVERHRRTGRLLDIGCGRGLFLALARQRGWEVAGTELSPEAAASGRQKYELSVFAGDVTQAQYPTNHFDVVTLFHVLEHLSLPRATLEEVKRILKPRGLLVVAVPDAGGWQARWGGPHWFHVDVPRHTVHFTRESLADMLRRTGFAIVREYHFSLEYDPFGLLQTWYNWLGFDHNLLYTALRRRDWWRDLNFRKCAQLGGLLLLLPLLGLVAVSLSLIAALLRRGGTLEVHCVLTNADSGTPGAAPERLGTELPLPRAGRRGDGER
jgi:SAM-dependent methyltransferase